MKKNANCQVHLSLRAKDWGDGGAAPLAAFRRRLDRAKRLAGLLIKHRATVATLPRRRARRS